VQLDEPSLPDVLVGHVRTASGFDVLRTPEAREVAERLAAVAAGITGAGAVPGAHCCAPHPPVAALREGGARFVSVDVTLLTPYDDEPLGEALEAGVGLLAGLVPTAGPLPGVAAALRPLRALAGRLGLSDERLAGVAVTPTCGLAGADPARAAATLGRAEECARELAQ